jgi:hypothetical protein
MKNWKHYDPFETSGTDYSTTRRRIPGERRGPPTLHEAFLVYFLKFIWC